MSLNKCKGCKFCILSNGKNNREDALLYAKCKKSTYIDECGFSEYAYCSIVRNDSCDMVKKDRLSGITEISGIIVAGMLMIIMIIGGIIGSM